MRRQLFGVVLCMSAIMPSVVVAQRSAVIPPQLGVHAESRLTASSAVGYRLPASVFPPTSASADSTAHVGNRSMHIAIGVVAGMVAGVLLGKSVDKGTAGCGHEQSGSVCTWGSGLYVPVFGLVLGAVGGVIGAFVPHS